MRKQQISACLALSLAMAAASVASGQIVTSDPTLPPTTGAYTTAPGSVSDYNTGGGLDIQLLGVVYSNFTNIQRSTSGNNELDTFNTTASGDISVNGGPAIPVTLTGPVDTTTFSNVGDTTGTFNTQITSLNLSGSFAGHIAELELDPSNASTGQSAITDIGGGLYQINSFFDVFTDLSLDGGPVIPQINAPTVLTLNNLPEPSSLSVLAITGMALLRRRSKRFSPPAMAYHR